jgi:hypothetical protein
MLVVLHALRDSESSAEIGPYLVGFGPRARHVGHIEVLKPLGRRACALLEDQAGRWAGAAQATAAAYAVAFDEKLENGLSAGYR